MDGECRTGIQEKHVQHIRVLHSYIKKITKDTTRSKLTPKVLRNMKWKKSRCLREQCNSEFEGADHQPTGHPTSKKGTCIFLILLLVGVECQDLHSDRAPWDSTSNSRWPHLMRLHVLLHIGLLRKGTTTHDALEWFLPCVTGEKNKKEDNTSEDDRQNSTGE